METKIEVPSEVRELVAISIDNIEKALALFFDAATKSIAPSSPEVNRAAQTGYRCKNGLCPKACARERPFRSDRIAVCVLPITSGNHD